MMLVTASLLSPFSLAAFSTRADSLRSVWRGVLSESISISVNEKLDLLYEIGESLRNKAPDSSLYFYQLAYDVAQANNLTLKKGTILNRIGYANYMLGNFSQALPLFMEALSIHQQLQNDAGISASLNSIGLIYETQKNYKQALAYQWRSRFYSKRSRDPDRLISNYYNLSMIHDDMGNYDSALTYLNRSIAACQASENERMLAMSFNRLGLVYFHLGDLEEAKKSYRQSLEIQSPDNKWEACFSFTGLARVYRQQGDIDTSLELALESFQLANQTKSKWEISDAAYILYENYKSRMDFEKALKMLEIAKQYADSLFNEDRDKELNYLHLMQNESEKNRLSRENELQKSVIEQSNLWVGFFITVGILLGIWGLSLYQNNRHRTAMNGQLKKKNQNIEERNATIEKQNEELNELNEAKNQLLSIVGHDMRGPIHNIKTILEIIKDGRLSPADQEKVFDNLYKTVGSVAETMDNMLTWASSQIKGLQIVQVHVDVAELVDETMKMFMGLAHEKEIRLVHEKMDGILVLVDANHFKTVLRNLISNAIKFTKRYGQVTIEYQRHENNQVVIHVIDNGVGIPLERFDRIFKFNGRSQSVGTANERGTGIGLMLSKEFIESNNGRIEVSSEEGVGSRFSIWLPGAMVEVGDAQSV